MEEIVNYLANHQERMRFPDRQAKQIRNHPFMTQLDFFDTNEEQKRAWEVQQRKQEVKEIAIQAGTSEAMEVTRKTKKSRGDTGIMRPGGVSRAEQREQYDDDVGTMRLNPSTYQEHDAESKTLRHERGTKSDTMAQTVRFSLRDRVVRPDAAEAPVHPGIHLPRLPVGVKGATNLPVEAGEREPVPVGIRDKVGIKVPIRVADEEMVREGVPVPDEATGSLQVKQREKEMKKDGMLLFALKEKKKLHGIA